MKHFHLVVITLFMIALLAGACAPQPPSPVQAAAPAVAATNPAPPAIQSGDRIVSEGEAEPILYASIHFSIPGTVAEVYVKEGDVVKKGQDLARLKGSQQLLANISAAEVELLAAEQALDQIQKNANVARANALLALAQANKKLDDEKDDRASKAFKRANQSTIETARAANIVAEDAYRDAEEKWQGFVGKDENDVNRAAVLTELARARQERDRTRANLDYVEAYPDAFEIAIADGELSLAQANYEKAVRDYDLVKNGPNPDDIALAEARIENAKAQLEAAKVAPDDQVLVSPMDGTIVTLGLKAGEQAGPAQGAVLIADLSAFQVVTTDLTELSVVDIQEGMPVTISFDALEEWEVTGKVERINALGVDKQGDITYTVTIKMDEQNPRLRWKMTASVSFADE